MWFLFALSFAILSSFGTIIAKRILKTSNEYAYIWLGGLFILPFLFFIIFFFYQIPSVDKTFTLATLGSISLDVVAIFLAIKAVRMSEISLINPISAFKPVFTALISYFTLGEIVGARGLSGILLIVLGAYLLQISKFKEGFFEPFRTLFSNKGVQFFLASQLIWAITPSLQKTAIFHTIPSVPPFASFVGLIGMTLIYSPLVSRFSKNTLQILKNSWKLFLLGGILGAIAQVPLLWLLVLRS